MNVDLSARGSVEEIVEKLKKGRGDNLGLMLNVILHNQGIINEQLNKLLEKKGK